MLLVFFAFGFHRLDAEDLVSVAQHLDIEHDLIARLEFLNHRFLCGGKGHRHGRHETRDRVVLDDELILSYFHDDAVSDEGAFASSGRDGCGTLGRRFRCGLRFGFCRCTGDGESYYENCKDRELQKTPPV